MAQFDSRSMVEAATATLGTAASVTGPRRLAGAAEQAATEPVAPAMSPIVLAGAVRIIEFALVALIGTAIYAAYVVPTEGVSWHYFGAVAAVAVLAMLAFQIADIYQVQAFRGHEKQYFRLASAWSVVFLLVIGGSFFAKAGEQFSRVWLGSFYVVGLLALLTSRRMLFLMVRRWTKEGRLTRRTAIVGGGEAGESLIGAVKAERDSDVRIVGVFDDRADDRSPTHVAGERKLGTVDDLVEFARRTRVDLVIFTLPISAEGRILTML
jgi:FlaA1/EpsC-like NDP-sugar epimerase